MENLRKSFLVFAVLFSFKADAQLYPWYTIPERQIILNELNPSLISSHDIKIKVKKFELSHEQVSLASYKIFLNDVRKDSGEVVYQSLLPDTNIGPKDIREKYFNSGLYDDYPVVGVSWDNALKYCRWLTLKNKKDTLKTIYRLPNLYEYYSAFTYLQTSAIDNNLNQHYSDWLMDAKDESVFTSDTRNIALGYYYFHTKTDPPVMKRKSVIGKSFHQSFNAFYDYLKLSYYADEGYRHIGFRILKDSSPEVFEIKGDVYTDPLLQYWNIKPEVK